MTFSPQITSAWRPSHCRNTPRSCCRSHIRSSKHCGQFWLSLHFQPQPGLHSLSHRRSTCSCIPGARKRGPCSRRRYELRTSEGEPKEEQFGYWSLGSSGQPRRSLCDTDRDPCFVLHYQLGTEVMMRSLHGALLMHYAVFSKYPSRPTPGAEEMRTKCVGKCYLVQPVNAHPNLEDELKIS
ncbi:hypothetical protein BDW66DRAFT_122443 [Aspergillus desertorum]